MHDAASNRVAAGECHALANTRQSADDDDRAGRIEMFAYKKAERRDTARLRMLVDTSRRYPHDTQELIGWTRHVVT